MKKFTTVSLIIVLTLASYGCDKPQPIDHKEVSNSSQTYTYYLRTSKSHVTSRCYPLDLDIVTKYKNILNLCPINLYLMSFDKYYKTYLVKLAKVSSKKDTDGSPHDYKRPIAGQHVYDGTIRGWPDNHIFVNAYDNPHKIMATYFHELGHNDCYKKRCKHCKDAGHKVEGELHAMIAELEKSMAHDLPDALLEAIRVETSFVNNYDDHKKYADATLEIYEMPLWTEVVTYLGSKGILEKNIPRSGHSKNCFIGERCTK